MSVDYLIFHNLQFDYPVGSNFIQIKKFQILFESLDASQKYLSDCQKSFGYKMLRGKTRA